MSKENVNAGYYADALKARMLLVFGGVAGVHRLYIEHIPEAFIFASTAGVFMLGVFHDSFYMHAIVDKYNDRQVGDDEENRKYRNGKPIPAEHRVIPFSVSHFVFSILYGMWLGLLCWAAGSVTFGRTMQDSIVMISAMAAAVSAGVYLVGNREGESRNLLFIWMASYSTAFVVSRVLDGSCLRVLFFSAMAATLLGNRSAKVRPPSQKTFNLRHYVFWCSLFALLLCVIAVGTSRHILDKRVSASKPGESTITSSVGSLLYDRFYKPDRVWSFFKDAPKLEYKKSPQTKRSNKVDSWWDPDVVGRAPQWADHVAVFVVDLLRAEGRSIDKHLGEEPLKWACWRVYLIAYFDASPFVSDKEISRMCTKWKRERELSKKEQTEKEAEASDADYTIRAVTRACQVVTK